ncbi:putative tyrosine carboxypeptidase MATCAP2 [Bombina bombina]|uniref:putative tyrosine carboxypeptidase MATCAP2 n=1 Tax=Bombina bombina TaxID=8345 RepID=UPI00235A8524|nr:putative tyrosine carboxypeptidase MATCAP2 [Bombina bombina]
MQKAIDKYGSYERFEKKTGGTSLSNSCIQHHVQNYLSKEGCLSEMKVSLKSDVPCRASMGITHGSPTLTINTTIARSLWMEGTLRHEIGTHYFRMINNKQQTWNSKARRRLYHLSPKNSTEEGLATINTVLFHEDPLLWHPAALYYTVYQASQSSFSKVFRALEKFVEDPNVRWNYCVRAKRGQIDTSKSGCFSKDQVYLEGVLHLLRHRATIDFKLLTSMGKVSYKDLDRLKEFAVLDNTRIPSFLHDWVKYMQCLDNIMRANEICDEHLAMLIG